MFNITVIGTGYVGLVSGTIFAEKGNRVICLDIDQAKIDALLDGNIPIYEDGLEELVKKNVKNNRLDFTTDSRRAVQSSDIIFIAVGTPPAEDGSADLRYIQAVCTDIAIHMNQHKIVVTKSTVPVGTAEKVRQWIEEKQSSLIPFDVASCPEFLREGSAVADSLTPDRIVIGSSNPETVKVLRELHEPFNAPIIETDTRSAEMIKYASNAFLATKISFMNEIANICEKLGADVSQVADGIGLDKRIGPHFLKAGVGFGGSCFPKDTRALIQIAENVDHDFELLRSVVRVNETQRLIVIDKLERHLGNLEGKTIGILGLAFKPNTDDMREAPSIDVIHHLLERRCSIKAYDPVAMSEAKRILPASVQYCLSVAQLLEEVDAVVILTEWDEFKRIDWTVMKDRMNHAVVIDGRNIFDPEKMKEYGMDYSSFGRKTYQPVTPFVTT